MTQLKLFLLGSPRIELDGVSIDLRRRKILALLFYLAVTRQQHRRDALATLFWPETSQAAARAALRRELHVINQTLGSEWLVTERNSVGINKAAELWVDVHRFFLELDSCRAHVHDDQMGCVACQAALVRATSLYLGDFLTGLTLSDCPDFDNWQFFETDTLRRAYAGALQKLVDFHHAQADYAAAIDYARRWLALDYTHEPAQRELIRLFAATGQYTSVLRQYEECVRILKREFGLSPEPETTALYESIRSRRLPKGELPIDRAHKTILTRQSQSGAASNGPVMAQSEKAVHFAWGEQARPALPLIGREAEWQHLQTAWHTAQANGAHCVVVAGEAGIGKTRLAEELLAWAWEQRIDSAYARSYPSQGELAYVPVVELLRTVPLQHRLAHLENVWLPHLARLLPEVLTAHPELPTPEFEMDSWQRQQLFEALARTCRALPHPLLLVLDDLQWSDQETLDWLHYLVSSRRHSSAQPTERAPLLVVGTIRTGEPGNTQALQRLLWGLRYNGQLTHLDLSPLSPTDTATLAIQIADQPLEPAFIDLLHQNTAGNPLFIVETVRAGATVWPTEAPEQRQWVVESPAAALPPKVYAVIQWRLGQLSTQAQEIAGLAAVIRRSFSFDLLRAASQLDEEILVIGLDELWERRIIRERGAEAYDFSHDRIRDVAYSQVGPARRRLLHRRIVNALEMIHAHQLDSVSGELATQCEQAGLTKRALDYYARAAAAAQRVGAYQEGMALIRRGLALLETMPDTLERLAQELALQMQLLPMQRTALGYAASAQGQTLSRARELCHQLNKQALLHHVLIGLNTHFYGRSEFERCKTLAKELLVLAHRSQEPMAFVEGHHAMGTYHFAVGGVQAGLIHLEQALHHYAPQHHQDYVSYFGFNFDPFARSFVVHTLWLLGYPEQAVQQLEVNLAKARALAHPPTLALALAYAAMLYQFRREPAQVQQLAAETIALSAKHGITYYELWATMLYTWAVAVQTERADRLSALSAMQRNIEQFRATESSVRLPYYTSLAVDLCLRIGQVEQGLAMLREAEEFAVSTGETWWCAELHRLRGELLQRQGATPEEAAFCFGEAINLARQQGARMLELRATVSLARLWAGAGKQVEAALHLTNLLGGFSERWESPDLAEAQTLLKRLRTSAAPT